MVTYKTQVKGSLKNGDQVYLCNITDNSVHVFENMSFVSLNSASKITPVKIFIKGEEIWFCVDDKYLDLTGKAVTKAHNKIAYQCKKFKYGTSVKLKHSDEEIVVLVFPVAMYTRINGVFASYDIRDFFSGKCPEVVYTNKHMTEDIYTDDVDTLTVPGGIGTVFTIFFIIVILACLALALTYYYRKRKDIDF